MNKGRIVKHSIKWTAILLPLLTLGLLVAALIHYGAQRWDDDPDRGAIAMPQVDQFGDSFSQVSYLNPVQGWTPRQSLWFYTTTQGSNLLPYSFFLNLEQTGSQELFRSQANMNHYRYLVQKPTYSNPDGLPVGMVANSYRGKTYMGLTCAACHTSQVNVLATQGAYKNQFVGLRIDGGPAMSDMESFMRGLAAALAKTNHDSAKRQRFVDAVLKHGGDYSTEQEVREDLQKTLQTITDYNLMNDPHTKDGKPVNYGYARLDAFGRIYNRVLEHVVTPEQLGGVLQQGLAKGAPSKLGSVPQLVQQAEEEEKPIHLIAEAERQLGLSQEQIGKMRRAVFNSPNAPVSYPFLWDTPQHDYVQWNGLAANAGVGGLGRNAGEVIGVFGTLDWHEEKNGWLYSLITGQGLHSKSISYESSVDVSNLRRLESQVAELHSPTWPAEFIGLPDTTRSARGRLLFDQYCASCHIPIDRDGKDRRVIAHLSDIRVVKTDPAMALNSVNYQGLSGMLRNQYVDVGVGKMMLDKTAPVASLLTKTTEGVVLTTPDSDKFFLWRWAQRLADFVLTYFDNEIPSSSIKHGAYQPDTTASPYSSLTAYKARSLNGIWATAPYLHNGSVPNLYALLLPKKHPDDPENGEYRPDQFYVGSRQFDPKYVGFKSSGYPGFLFDTSIPGNGNEGHEYGTGKDDKPVLTAEQRWDLVEYLKGL